METEAEVDWVISATQPVLPFIAWSKKDFDIKVWLFQLKRQYIHFLRQTLPPYTTYIHAHINTYIQKQFHMKC